MKLKTILKGLKKLNITYFRKMKYISYYEKEQINQNIIFLEAQNGKSINGNVYYIAKELTQNEEYKNYAIYFSILKDKYNVAKEILKRNGMERIKLIEKGSIEYYKLLAKAKYFIIDTSMPPCFIKKDGQVIFDTWHGTPLKTLGKKVNNEFHTIGNVQRTFFMADYLLYPNEYMKEHMLEDYMLPNLSSSKIILAGYPRNTVFFDEELKNRVRKEQNLENKEVLVYMPTWRGTVGNVEDNDQEIINEYLIKLDENLKDNQILYVNLHPFIADKVDYTNFKKVKQFPKEYETYEFLSTADCLITDYSSVFYDFANTMKKVILFTYDEEEYLKDRGLYISLNELPFPKVNTIEELINKINTPKEYDDKEFLNTYCKYDNINVTKELCKKVILGEQADLSIEDMPNNNKDNVLIFTGNLSRNGITSSLKSLLNNIDIEKRNYYINFRPSHISKYKDVIKEFPKEIGYIPTQNQMNLPFWKKVELVLFEFKLILGKKYIKDMSKYYEYEIKRSFVGVKFSDVIQFSGYGYKQIILYSLFNANKIIYTHSDMIEEIKIRHNQRLDVLQYAYNKYDKIAMVADGLREHTKQISGRGDNLVVANNLINYKRVIELSKKAVKFDDQTECSVSEEELNNILASNNKKIITIGRFSVEKGHKRLIKAFDKVWQNNKSAYLIIIGGHGNQYDQSIKLINKLKSKNNIILIKNMSNPYSVLKKCDYFILSSLYEGFGLVLAEANILGKPVISTDNVGAREFMNKYSGTLVENSEDGIYKGLELLLDDKVKVIDVDYEEYNKEAVKQFEKMLEK